MLALVTEATTLSVPLEEPRGGRCGWRGAHEAPGGAGAPPAPAPGRPDGTGPPRAPTTASRGRRAPRGRRAAPRGLRAAPAARNPTAAGRAVAVCVRAAAA